eukprot:939872-Rhodomonas_salina.2
MLLSSRLVTSYMWWYDLPTRCLAPTALGRGILPSMLVLVSGVRTDDSHASTDCLRQNCSSSTDWGYGATREREKADTQACATRCAVLSSRMARPGAVLQRVRGKCRRSDGTGSYPATRCSVLQYACAARCPVLRYAKSGTEIHKCYAVSGTVLREALY